MNNSHKRSHSRKLEKRRKNTKLMSVLLMIAGVLLLVLIAIWIFGGKDEQGIDPNKNASDPDDAEIEDDPNSNDEDTSNPPEKDEGDNLSAEVPEIGESQDGDDLPVEIQQVEPADDNVIEAYTGDWQAIGTVQAGPHTTDYADDSHDRIEIKQAIMLATGLSDDLRTWWIGNGGDQKVVATVSDHNETKTYRVYLAWINNEGWQPTKVEILKENDKK